MRPVRASVDLTRCFFVRWRGAAACYGCGMREADLLSRIALRARAEDAGSGPVRIGPGDDCAVVDSPGGGPPLLLTVDQLIEERHFYGPVLPRGDVGADIGPAGRAVSTALSQGTPSDLVARKAVARSVSDIAAMAGTPVWSLGTVALPADFPQAMAEELCDAAAEWAKAWGCPMVGGDIAATAGAGPVLLTVTVAGVPATARGPVLRSGARVGDGVWVTGRVGGSVASGRHLTFEPRVAEAAWLARTLGEGLHAMIDISDGVGMDASRIAAASGVRVRLESGLLPLHTGVIDWRAAIADGEDYELLFTAAGDARLPERCPETGTRLTKIGVVMEGVGGAGGAVVVDERGGEVDATQMGWDHGQASIHRSRDNSPPRGKR